MTVHFCRRFHSWRSPTRCPVRPRLPRAPWASLHNNRQQTVLGRERRRRHSRLGRHERKRLAMKIHFKIVLMIVFGLLQLGSTLGKDLKSAVSVPKRREDQIVAFHEARTSTRPFDADAWRLLAGAYVQRAVVTGDGLDYDRGWEMLHKAEELDPGDPRILQARAELLLSRHHFQGARDLAEQGLAKDPENTELLAVAGDGALETGDLDSATAYYRRLKGVGARLTTWARLAHAAE